MEDLSGNKESLSFKSPVTQTNRMTFHTGPIHPVQDMTHLLVPCIHTVYTTHLVVTQ